MGVRVRRPSNPKNQKKFVESHHQSCVSIVSIIAMTDNHDNQQPQVNGSDIIAPIVISGEKDRVSSRRNDNEATDLKVKSEFIRQTDAPETVLDTTNSNSRDASTTVSRRDMRDEDGGGFNRKKKNRGMNRKRPRDAREPDSGKICLAILRGEPCGFGDKCKFSHDIKAYLASRPPDIKEVEGGCPSFKLTGCVIQMSNFLVMLRLTHSYLMLPYLVFLPLLGFAYMALCAD